MAQRATCAVCTSPIWLTAKSLPAGQATCQPCRRQRPKKPPAPKLPDTPCAGCGKLLYGCPTSLPPGERTCRECRRARRGPAVVVQHPLPFCGGCGQWFNRTRADQRWCQDCREARAMGHRWANQDRKSAATKARRAKYNSPEHKAARAHITVMVVQGRAYCWRCNKQLVRGRWHVGHNDAGDRIMGGECADCNLRAAARKGALIANAKRKAQRFVRPVR